MLKKFLTVFAIMLFVFSFSQQKGKATWYGAALHGNKTASGAIFNMHGFTTASNTHPFGTKLKVTNVRNNKSVVVTVTDRGAFSNYGVLLDLSRAAFAKIADLSTGKITVIVSVLTKH